MAVKSSGTFLKFSEIASEFNDSQPHRMSEFTRGGGKVPDTAANSNIRDAAARQRGLPEDRMKFSDYYGSRNAIAITINSLTQNLDLATLFNANQSGSWAGSDAKILTINSGVTVGATSVSNAALTITSGMGGTLTITNNGSIEGAGGSANGGNGGDAIQASSSNVTLINNGNIYAGGGGGGQGGTGGTGGQGSSTSTTGHGSAQHCQMRGAYCTNTEWNLACTNAFGSNAFCASGKSTVISRSCMGNMCNCSNCESTSTTIHNGGAGGAGGSGGVGQGYNQSAGSGSAGSAGGAGGTNAGSGGSGGTGGNGGSFGASGSSGATGNTGANGNHSNGSAGSGGSGGGAAGDYISGLSNLTFTNNGNVAGTTS